MECHQGPFRQIFPAVQAPDPLPMPQPMVQPHLLHPVGVGLIKFADRSMTWLAIHAKLLLLICPKSHPTKNYRRDVHGLFHTDQLGWKSAIAKIIGITYRGGNVTDLITNYG